MAPLPLRLLPLVLKEGAVPFHIAEVYIDLEVESMAPLAHSQASLLGRVTRSKILLLVGLPALVVDVAPPEDPIRLHRDQVRFVDRHYPVPHELGKGGLAYHEKLTWHHSDRRVVYRLGYLEVLS